VTAQRYITLLEQVFLVATLQPWYTFEVKAGATVGFADFAGLRTLAAACKDKFASVSCSTTVPISSPSATSWPPRPCLACGTERQTAGSRIPSAQRRCRLSQRQVDFGARSEMSWSQRISISPIRCARRRGLAQQVHGVLEASLHD
jgi:hypothetical protein